jgi:diacylglycerol kinase family enzyme/membrane-associated phospholipid phosphatase
MVLPEIHAWDERWFAAQAGRHSSLGDAVLPRLTRAADRSVLWIGLAVALAGAGGQRGRHAARRGMGSIAVASLLANQVGKRLLPRTRPTSSLVPLTRLARRIPTSPSFPSGHSASAAAFAVGVGLEIPELAVPLGLAATAVCWSRVYTGVHYPTDVVAGAALGVAAAVLVARVVPAAHLRAPNAPAPDTVRLPPRPTGRGVVIVVNQRAGLRGRHKHLLALAEALPDAEIMDVGEGDLIETLQAAAKRAEVLGIFGGDGSVNAAAGVAHERGLPLAVLPGGTFNHFARDLGVQTVEDTCAAITTGTAIQVRLGRVSGADGSGQIFVNTASLGSYPEFVQLRRRWEGRLGKPIAAALAARAVLRTYEPEDVVIDGVERRIGLMFIGNGSYQPRGFAPEWRPSLTGGNLDVRLFDLKGRYPRTRLVADLLLGRVSRNPDYVEQLSPRLRITRSGPDLLALDGEVGPSAAELFFGVDPEPLTVLRPQ